MWAALRLAVWTVRRMRLRSLARSGFARSRPSRRRQQREQRYDTSVRSWLPGFSDLLLDIGEYVEVARSYNEFVRELADADAR